MNPFLAQRWWGYLPLFDPEVGTTIIAPENPGPGWWAGAPSISYDPGAGTWWLYYRLRKPRELGRGAECRIARSTDGVHFKTAWRATKEELDTPSMERSALMRSTDGTYHLFISYVDPADGRWRIDRMGAATPEALDVTAREKVFTADDVDAEGIKDPWVVMVGRLYHMIVSYAPTPPQPDEEAMHATADVYNTGLTKSHTGLALSTDCVNWRWVGDILTPPEAGWDSYATRICSVVWTPPVFTGFYDGSASVEENYEERTGLVVSHDLRTFTRVSVDEPALVSTHASGSLRYLDALVQGGHLWCYYEYAREDGSHELRLSRVPWPYE